MENGAALTIGGSPFRGIIFLTYAAKFSLHATSARQAAVPSSARVQCLATLRTSQPRAQGIDASDGFAGSFLVRPAEFAGNWHRAGFAESQIPRAGTTATGADATHVLRLLVK
jgi:hypothetical protein